MRSIDAPRRGQETVPRAARLCRSDLRFGGVVEADFLVVQRSFSRNLEPLPQKTVKNSSGPRRIREAGSATYTTETRSPDLTSSPCIRSARRCTNPKRYPV